MSRYIFIGMVLLFCSTSRSETAKIEVSTNGNTTNNFASIMMNEVTIYGKLNTMDKLNWETDFLKGRVRQYWETTTQLDDHFGEFRHNIISENIRSYDTNGNRISWAVYNASGDLQSKEFYGFDTHFNLLTRALYSARNQLQYRESLRYDEKGNRIIKDTFLGDDTLINRDVSNVDEDGGYHRETTFYRDWFPDIRDFSPYELESSIPEGIVPLEGVSVANKTATQFDPSGKIVNKQQWGNDNVVWYLETYRYDKSGKLRERDRYRKDILIDKTLYKYDRLGRLVTSQHFSSDMVDPVSTTTYVYDEIGMLVERNTTLPDGSPDNSHFYTYNDDGQLIRDSLVSAGIMQDLTKYEYDSYGNIVKVLAYRLEDNFERKDYLLMTKITVKYDYY